MAILLPRTEFQKVHYIACSLNAASLTNTPTEQKHLKERLALKYLSCLAKPVNQAFADEIDELWWEFETGGSKAAMLVRSVDALECMHQAVVYEGRSRLNNDLSEFMDLEQKITAPELGGWVAYLKAERKTLWSNAGAADVTFLFVLGMLPVYFCHLQLTSHQEGLVLGREHSVLGLLTTSLLRVFR